MRKTVPCFLLAAVTTVLTSGHTAGQEKSRKESQEPKTTVGSPEDKKPVVRALTIHPAPETKPALRDHLAPSFLEQTPQNAAPLYLRAFIILGENSKSEEDDELIAKWLQETPLEELPIAEVKELLARYENPISEVEKAARRERCEWDLPIRESGTDLFSVLLPDVQQARRIGRMLALRARMEIAEDEFEQAVGTLRTVLTLARHVGRQPFLVSGLVGLAIARQALDVLHDFSRSKHSPNLYWPLTNLPKPVVDLGPGVRLEHVAVFLVFPELQDVATDEYADEEWNRRAEVLLGRGKSMAALFVGEDEANELLQPKAVEESYAAARARLLERGSLAADLDKMPKSRVVLLDIAESFAETRDEMYKAFGLPYPQAKKVLDGVQKSLNRSKTRGYGGRLAALLLPAVQAVKAASARGQLAVDALRCIEALRMHAAEHGELPARLGDVAVAPIPLNPLTGRPFAYRLEDGVATLDLEDHERPTVYRIRLAK